MFHRNFLKDEYGVLGARLSNLDCVIDIGGHIGAFSFLVAPLSGRVLTFEPIAENFDLLKRNLSPPEFRHVTCVNAAVTDRKKEVRIYKSSASGSHSAYQSNRVSGEFEVAPGMSLGDIFTEYGVEKCNLLKIDCEGAEYEILLSAGEDVMSRIFRIVLEYHDVAEDKHAWNVDTLARYLKKRGFNVETKPSRRHVNQGIMCCHR